MNNANKNMTIEDLKNGIFSDNWDTAISSADKLVKIGGDDVVKFLIGLLESKNADLRNIAALALRDLEDNKAIDPLLNSIFNPENKNNNGTLVYALQTLDCKNKLVEIFRILFYQGFEAKMGAYKILNKQIFEFNRNNLLEIQRMWNDCCQSPEHCEGFDKEQLKLMMQDAYEGFMEYLK